MEFPIFSLGHVEIMRNKISWFNKDENSSRQVSAHLFANSTIVKDAIGDRILLVVQKSTLLIATFIISFSLQWKVAFIILSTFPLLVFSSLVEVIKPNSQSV